MCSVKHFTVEPNIDQTRFLPNIHKVGGTEETYLQDTLRGVRLICVRISKPIGGHIYTHRHQGKTTVWGVGRGFGSMNMLGNIGKIYETK